MKTLVTPRRTFSMRDYLLVVSAALVILIALAAFWYRDDILYNLRLLNAKVVADRFYSEYRGIAKNIPYGELPREKLDVYQPATAGLHAVMIWVHGGGWNSGEKELYAPVAQKVIPEDIVVVIPSYTLFPEGNAFQQTKEIARAFAWTRDNISKYGGDPQHITVGGQSAGAHLTALMTFDPQYLAAVNHSTREICGVYGIAGPYSIKQQLDYQRNVKHDDGALLFQIFDGEKNFERGSPLSFARSDLPPILLIHGDADETVPLAESKALQDALLRVGATSELKIYPGAGHAGLLFDALAQEKPRLVQDLVAFAKNCPPIK